MFNIFTSIFRNKINKINELVNETNVNLRNRRGQTLFHYAVLHDQLEIAQVLLEKGADFSITCYAGRNALHDMAFNDELGICLWLIEDCGMNPFVKCNNSNESAITHYSKWVNNSDPDFQFFLTEEEKKNCIKQLIEARSNYIREQNWQRRKNFVCSLFISEMLLLNVKKTANAIIQENLDKSKKLISISRKTKEQNISFLEGKVFGEEGIARRIISYI